MGDSEFSRLSGDELTELCRRLEAEVTTGTAPLALYGQLASAHRELQSRSEAFEEVLE